MTTKHTPGPWRVEKRLHTIKNRTDKTSRESPTFYVTSEAHGELAKVPTHFIRVSEHDEANTRLIAAAPEMLEALKCALQRLKELQNATGYPTAHPQIEIEKIIARAEGKELSAQLKGQRK